MKLDFDLVFGDFADAFANDPDRALHALQALLLDESACRARITFLERLAPNSSRKLQGDFSTEIRSLTEIEVASALKTGQLRPERLAALTRDPGALWQAHQAVLGAEATLSSQPGSFTQLVLTGKIDDLIERLRPYLHELLQATSIPTERAAEVLDFVRRRAGQPETGRRHFHELFPSWLAEFAQEQRLPAPHPLGRDEWQGIIDRAVLCLVLEDRPAEEPDWARAFRQKALDSSVSAWQDLLRIPGSGEEAAALPVFRRELVFRVQQERQRAAALFELN